MGQGKVTSVRYKRPRGLGQAQALPVPGVAVVVVETRQQRRHKAAQAAKGVLRVHPAQVAHADGDLDDVTLVRRRPSAEVAAQVWDEVTGGRGVVLANGKPVPVKRGKP
jgi:hypothetical protein